MREGIRIKGMISEPVTVTVTLIAMKVKYYE
jgi:hypothetical protein